MRKLLLLLLILIPALSQAQVMVSDPFVPQKGIKILSGYNSKIHYLGKKANDHWFIQEFSRKVFQNNQYRLVIMDENMHLVREKLIRVDSLYTINRVNTLQENLRNDLSVETKKAGYQDVRILGLSFNGPNKFLITQFTRLPEYQREVWAFPLDSNFNQTGAELIYVDLLDNQQNLEGSVDNKGFTLSFSPDSSLFSLCRAYERRIHEGNYAQLDHSEGIIHAICFDKDRKLVWEYRDENFSEKLTVLQKLEELNLSNSGSLIAFYRSDLDIKTAEKQKNGSQVIFNIDSRGLNRIELADKKPFYTVNFYPKYTETGELSYLLALGSSRGADLLDEILVINFEAGSRSKRQRTLLPIPRELLKKNKLHKELQQGVFRLQQWHTTSDAHFLVFDRYARTTGKVYYTVVLQLTSDMNFTNLQVYDHYAGNMKNRSFDPAGTYSYMNESATPTLLFLDLKKNIKKKTRPKPKKGDYLAIAGFRTIPKEAWVIKAPLNETLQWNYAGLFPLTDYELYKGRISCSGGMPLTLQGKDYIVLPFIGMEKGTTRFIFISQ